MCVRDVIVEYTHPRRSSHKVHVSTSSGHIETSPQQRTHIRGPSGTTLQEHSAMHARRAQPTNNVLKAALGCVCACWPRITSTPASQRASQHTGRVRVCCAERRQSSDSFMHKSAHDVRHSRAAIRCDRFGVAAVMPVFVYVHSCSTQHVHVSTFRCNPSA